MRWRAVRYDPGVDPEEEARKQRMREEMARSVMSGLRDDGESVSGGLWSEKDGTVNLGGQILEGEVLGDIVTVSGDVLEGSAATAAVHSPVAAGRAVVVPTGRVIDAGGDWRHGAPAGTG